MKLLERFACGRCGDTLPPGTAPRWLRDPSQPLPGTKIGVCAGCFRAARSTLRQVQKCGPAEHGPTQPALRGGAIGEGGAPAPLDEAAA